MVLDTILRLKREGIGIFLISHDMADVFRGLRPRHRDEERPVVDTVNRPTSLGRGAQDDHSRQKPKPNA